MVICAQPMSIGPGEPPTMLPPLENEAHLLRTYINIRTSLVLNLNLLPQAFRPSENGIGGVLR